MRKDFQSPRPTHERDILALKGAFRQLVIAAGGQESAASITRVSQSQISRAGSTNEMETLPALDVIADLEMDTGRPIVTQALARLTGHEVVALPPAGETSPAAWMAHLGRLIAEAGDVETALVAALADGRVTPDEAQRLDREADEVIEALVRFKRDARRVARGEEGV
ncbi:MAG TPA: hypothetical protein PLJ34_02420 [Hyphomicrobiales bacterium]|mgnify:CR=1 FL=1|nr:hypothetical protein [Hyphomicrobiales bacterium]